MVMEAIRCLPNAEGAISTKLCFHLEEEDTEASVGKEDDLLVSG